MTSRHFAALLAAVTLALGATALAADQPATYDTHQHARAIARDVERAVRQAMHEVRREIREVVRDIDRHDDWWRGFDRQQAREVSRTVTRAAREARAASRTAAREAARSARTAARSARTAERDARDAARDAEREARAFRQVAPTDDPCAEQRGSRDRGHACEVRDTRLGAPGSALTVDAAPNGGIRVEAWDQPDVLVRAVVQTWDETDDAARALLPQVRVQAAGASVSADGPDRDGNGRWNRGWSVSFRIWAPRAMAVDLRAVNGGVSLVGMQGHSRLRTTNGGLSLDDVGGEIEGRTTNGGVQVRLGGSRWDGAGLSLETTNGGVTMRVPRDYSAALDVSTVNGGFRTDLPIDLPEGRRRSVRTTLGAGGPMLKVQTHNGGVRLMAR